MNRILFLLIFCTFALSETILIPEDYTTIQEGIDASVDGDTVLVADGDYVENLVLNKSIVLTSYAIYDNLDEWIIFDDYFFNQWVINNPHIANTRIVGSSPDDPEYGSVILITPDSEECISPEIVGFTITGGSGTTVKRVNDQITYNQFPSSIQKKVVMVVQDWEKDLYTYDCEYYVLPKERNMIAQQLFLYSMSLPQGMDLNDRMTIENDSLRLTAMWNVHDSATILRVAEEIEAKGKELGLSVKVSGKSVLWQTITKPIITSFIKSLLLAIFLISILLIFGLRPIKIGLFALIPNALPLIFGGALLVILGKYLDIGTVIVGAITLGIAVDDTIHFLSSYMRFLNEGFNAKEAISRIFSLTVPALSVTTLVLAVSFGTFIFGDFVPNQNFGIMVALILTFALVADVLFLPALLMIVGEDFFVSKKKSNFQYEKPDGLVI